MIHHSVDNNHLRGSINSNTYSAVAKPGNTKLRCIQWWVAFEDCISADCIEEDSNSCRVMRSRSNKKLRSRDNEQRSSRDTYLLSKKFRIEHSQPPFQISKELRKLQQVHQEIKSNSQMSNQYANAKSVSKTSRQLNLPKDLISVVPYRKQLDRSRNTARETGIVTEPSIPSYSNHYVEPRISPVRDIVGRQPRLAASYSTNNNDRTKSKHRDFGSTVTCPDFAINPNDSLRKFARLHPDVSVEAITSSKLTFDLLRATVGYRQAENLALQWVDVIFKFGKESAHLRCAVESLSKWTYFVQSVLPAISFRQHQQPQGDEMNLAITVNIESNSLNGLISTRILAMTKDTSKPVIQSKSDGFDTHEWNLCITWQFMEQLELLGQVAVDHINYIIGVVHTNGWRTNKTMLEGFAIKKIKKHGGNSSSMPISKECSPRETAFELTDRRLSFILASEDCEACESKSSRKVEIAACSRCTQYGLFSRRGRMTNALLEPRSPKLLVCNFGIERIDEPFLVRLSTGLNVAAKEALAPDWLDPDNYCNNLIRSKLSVASVNLFWKIIATIEELASLPVMTTSVWSIQSVMITSSLSGEIIASIPSPLGVVEPERIAFQAKILSKIGPGFTSMRDLSQYLRKQEFQCLFDVSTNIVPV